MRPATMVSAIIIVTAMAAVSSQMGGSAKADIYNIRGEKIGTATLSQVPDGVRIGLEVSKLSPGMHGIHVHAGPPPACHAPTATIGQASHAGAPTEARASG